jgi:hypothetical protein
LYKLENPEIKGLFKTLGTPSISVSGNRIHLNKMYEEYFEKLVIRFTGKKIFLIVYESEINRKKYFNIMGTEVSEPKKIFLIDCISLESSMNPEIVKNLYLELWEK